jgi:dephospho-CoA kinase
MVIGLTGGIGCGKSMALSYFSTLDWQVVDADALCHQLYDEREAHFFGLLSERWGKKVFTQTGDADKAKIADIVFNDESELQWLNSVMHPIVKRRAKKLIETTDKQWIMFDVPLLFEAKWTSMFAATIAVWTPAKIQVERLQKRNWTTEQINARVNCQLSSDHKLEQATYGLINTGSETLLLEQCKRINNIIKEL